MKVVIYTLTPEGEIPEYIVDGGYFAKPNDKNAPQHLDFVGVATDEATESELTSLAELTAYAEAFMEASVTDFYGQTETLSDTLAAWWQEKQSI